MSENLIPGLIAGADLRSAQHTFVYLNADTPFEVQTISNASLPQIPIGVQLNEPDENEGVEVAGPGSLVKCLAGGSFDEGVTLVCNNSGRVIAGPWETSPATADLYIIGVSYQVSTGNGQVVFIMVTSPMLVSTE